MKIVVEDSLKTRKAEFLPNEVNQMDQRYVYIYIPLSDERTSALWHLAKMGVCSLLHHKDDIYQVQIHTEFVELSDE